MSDSNIEELIGYYTYMVEQEPEKEEEYMKKIADVLAGVEEITNGEA